MDKQRQEKKKKPCSSCWVTGTGSTASPRPGTDVSSLLMVVVVMVMRTVRRRGSPGTDVVGLEGRGGRSGGSVSVTTETRRSGGRHQRGIDVVTRLVVVVAKMVVKKRGVEVVTLFRLRRYA